MCVFSQISAYIKDVVRCSNLDEVNQQLREITSSLGAEYYIVTNRIYLQPDDVVAFMLTNYPSEWLSRLAQASVLQNDPAIARALIDSTPFRWSELDGLSKESNTVLNEARLHGLNDGMSVIVHSPGHYPCIMSMASSKPLSEEAFISLHYLATYTVKAALRIATSRLKDPWRREPSGKIKEALLFFGQGKTAEETSLILGTTKAAIEKRLSKARAFYRVTSTAQAFWRACVFGDIFLT